jgi:hypothetical protein
MFYKIKDIMDTCYGQVTLTSTTPNDFLAEQLRKSIDSFQHSAFNVKVFITSHPPCYTLLLFYCFLKHFFIFLQFIAVN